MLHTAVILSVIFGFMSSEFLGLLSGGLVSAGYIAFYIEQPFRIASTLLLATATTGLVKLSSSFLILFGRRRFALTILISMFLSFAIERTFFYFADLNQDLRIIGYLIPGLIANDMEKQGILKTLLAIVIIACAVWLLLRLGV